MLPAGNRDVTLTQEPGGVRTIFSLRACRRREPDPRKDLHWSTAHAACRLRKLGPEKGLHFYVATPPADERDLMFSCASGGPD